MSELNLGIGIDIDLKLFEIKGGIVLFSEHNGPGQGTTGGHFSPWTFLPSLAVPIGNALKQLSHLVNLLLAQLVHSPMDVDVYFCSR